MTASCVSTVAARTTSSDIYRRLNGVFSFYKPASYPLRTALSTIQLKLANELSLISDEEEQTESARSLSGRLAAVDGFIRVRSDTDRAGRLGDVRKGGRRSSLSSGGNALVKRSSSSVRNSNKLRAQWLAAIRGDSILMKNPTASPALRSCLMYGPAFLPKDFRLTPLSEVGTHTSGVVAVALNSGIDLLELLPPYHLRTYRITARLGFNTDTNFIDGRVTDRATHGHVTCSKLESLLSSLQAAHQRFMYEHCGVPINSHSAYELASAGLPRPVDDSTPMIYAIRLVHYAPPFFTLEVHAVSESEAYLLLLVQDLGRQLRSAATTLRLRCVRHGPFTVEDSLLLHSCGVPAVCRALGLSVPLLARYMQQANSSLLEPLLEETHKVPARWTNDDDDEWQLNV